MDVCNDRIFKTAPFLSLKQQNYCSLYVHLSSMPDRFIWATHECVIQSEGGWKHLPSPIIPVFSERKTSQHQIIIQSKFKDGVLKLRALSGIKTQTSLKIQTLRALPSQRKATLFKHHLVLPRWKTVRTSTCTQHSEQTKNYVINMLPGKNPHCYSWLSILSVPSRFSRSQFIRKQGRGGDLPPSVTWCAQLGEWGAEICMGLQNKRIHFIACL